MRNKRNKRKRRSNNQGAHTPYLFVKAKGIASQQGKRKEEEKTATAA
jgi:hypothetical protein